MQQKHTVDCIKMPMEPIPVEDLKIKTVVATTYIGFQLLLISGDQLGVQYRLDLSYTIGTDFVPMKDKAECHLLSHVCVSCKNRQIGRNSSRILIDESMHRYSL